MIIQRTIVTSENEHLEENYFFIEGAYSTNLVEIFSSLIENVINCIIDDVAVVFEKNPININEDLKNIIFYYGTELKTFIHLISFELFNLILINILLLDSYITGINVNKDKLKKIIKFYLGRIIKKIENSKNGNIRTLNKLFKNLAEITFKYILKLYESKRDRILLEINDQILSQLHILSEYSDSYFENKSNYQIELTKEIVFEIIIEQTILYLVSNLSNVIIYLISLDFTKNTNIDEIKELYNKLVFEFSQEITILKILFDEIKIEEFFNNNNKSLFDDVTIEKIKLVSELPIMFYMIEYSDKELEKELIPKMKNLPERLKQLLILHQENVIKNIIKDKRIAEQKIKELAIKINLDLKEIKFETLENS